MPASAAQATMDDAPFDRGKDAVSDQRLLRSFPR
jgi:hypothetical protein